MKMKQKCKRCGKDVTKEECPLDGQICENCCNEMLLGSPSPSFDWSHYDFEKGDFK